MTSTTQMLITPCRERIKGNETPSFGYKLGTVEGQLNETLPRPLPSPNPRTSCDLLNLHLDGIRVEISRVGSTFAASCLLCTGEVPGCKIIPLSSFGQLWRGLWSRSWIYSYPHFLVVAHTH